MIIRVATETDNEALLLLTKACPMEGSFKLLIDRFPDFFSLLKLKGDYKVFVAVDNLQIIGSFALVVKPAHIQQRAKKIGYLCDMKILPAHRNTLVAYRLMKGMLHYMRTQRINFYLCVTSRGNHLVESLLKGRVKFPDAYKVADFNVYQVFPLKRQPSINNHIQEYNNQFEIEVSRLLNNYYKHYNFSTVFDKGIAYTGDKSWVYLQHQRPVGFISVIDMESFRQNRVMKIPFYLKIAISMAKLVWPKITMPKEGEVLKILNIQYLAYDPFFKNAADMLLKAARHYAYVNGFTFLSYGIDARNPLATKMKSIPGIVFHSTGYVFDFSPQKKGLPNKLVHDNFYQI